MLKWSSLSTVTQMSKEEMNSKQDNSTAVVVEFTQHITGHFRDIHRDILALYMALRISTRVRSATTKLDCLGCTGTENQTQQKTWKNQVQAGRRPRSQCVAQISLPWQQGLAPQHFAWFH